MWCNKMFWGIVKVEIQVGPMQDYDESHLWEIAFAENRAFDNGIKICSEIQRLQHIWSFTASTEWDMSAKDM